MIRRGRTETSAFPDNERNKTNSNAKEMSTTLSWKCKQLFHINMNTERSLYFRSELYWERQPARPAGYTIQNTMPYAMALRNMEAVMVRGGCNIPARYRSPVGQIWPVLHRYQVGTRENPYRNPGKQVFVALRRPTGLYTIFQNIVFTMVLDVVTVMILGGW